MPNQSQSLAPATLDAMKLTDFGKLQERYQALSLPSRAQAVLADANMALQTADRILAQLSHNDKIEGVFERIRKNTVLTGKIRPSEAKNMLLDAGNDFIDMTRHKLLVWRKTMERISQGEGVMSGPKNDQYISSHVPLAMAISSATTVCSYLSMVQLAYTELSKVDADNAAKYSLDSAKIRRCATLLSDCENAARFKEMVH